MPLKGGGSTGDMIGVVVSRLVSEVSNMSSLLLAGSVYTGRFKGRFADTDDTDDVNILS